MTVSSAFMFTACVSGAQSKLSNDSGFVVECGGFADGSVLEATAIDSENEKYKQTLTAIASQSYDDSKPVYVFEISVKKATKKFNRTAK